MPPVDLLIGGSPQDLDELRRAISKTLGAQADIETVQSTMSGEYREPITIGIIVALGGPALIRAVVDIVKAHYAHQERHDEAAADRERSRMDHEFRLKILEHGSEREIDLQELAHLAEPQS